jgi:hypothetical protein
MGHQVTQIVSVVVQMGLADKLADGDRSSAELAEATGANPGALHRLLRAAASIGLLEQVDRNRFALTAMGRYLRSDPAGMGLSNFAAVNARRERTLTEFVALFGGAGLRLAQVMNAPLPFWPDYVIMEAVRS